MRRLRRLVISFDRHRRQLRVRVLLVPLQRRHDRVRGQALGRDLHRRDPGRRAAAARHARRPPGSTGPTTSTSSACGWTWRSTARQHRRRGRLRARRRSGPANPTGNAWRTVRNVAARPRREAQRLIDPLKGALLADREPDKTLRARATRRATSSCRARTSRRCTRPDADYAGALGLHAASTCG